MTFDGLLGCLESETDILDVSVWVACGSVVFPDLLLQVYVHVLLFVQEKLRLLLEGSLMLYIGHDCCDDQDNQRLYCRHNVKKRKRNALLQGLFPQFGLFSRGLNLRRLRYDCIIMNCSTLQISSAATINKIKA